MHSWQIVRIVTGLFILLSLALGATASPIFVSEHFLWLNLFVGANLLQSGWSRWCFLEVLLRRIGVKSGC